MAADPGYVSTALHGYVVGTLTMAETLALVCEEAVDGVRAAAWAGVTLRLDRRPGTFASTDPRVEEIDRVQFEARRGPGLDVMRSSHVVRIVDTGARGGRYERFAAAAHERGVGSTVSLPLVALDRRVGALSLYAPLADAFDDEAVTRAGRFAAEAAIVVANACAYWDLDSLRENLADAMATRATIEQAKGIIMATNRCDATAAFDLLVAQSQHENVKVRDLARELVARRSERAATSGENGSS